MSIALRLASRARFSLRSSVVRAAAAASSTRNASTTRFTKEHEWARVEGGVATCGVTDYAQSALGDVGVRAGRASARARARALIRPSPPLNCAGRRRRCVRARARARFARCRGPFPHRLPLPFAARVASQPRPFRRRRCRRYRPQVVFVSLPAVGAKVKKGEAIAGVESVKAASDVYAPVSGTVTEANKAVTDSPAIVNSGAEGAAWFVKIKVSDEKELAGMMDKAAYDKHVAASKH